MSDTTRLYRDATEYEVHVSAWQPVVPVEPVGTLTVDDDDVYITDQDEMLTNGVYLIVPVEGSNDGSP